MIYNVELKSYRLLCSYISNENILCRIRKSKVIDYTISLLGFTTAPQVRFELSDDDKSDLVEFFSDMMMDGFPHYSHEEQSNESKIYESLMYLLIQLKGEKY